MLSLLNNYSLLLLATLYIIQFGPQHNHETVPTTVAKPGLQIRVIVLHLNYFQSYGTANTIQAYTMWE